MNRPGYVNFNGQNGHEKIRPSIGSSRSRPIMDRWGVERNGQAASRGRARCVTTDGRCEIFPHRDEGSSSFDRGSYYGHGGMIRYHGDDFDGLPRVKNLENNRAEIIRKFDEVKDQLNQSCDVMDRPKQMMGMGQRMGPTPPDPYGRHPAAYVQGGLGNSYGVHKQPLAPDNLKSPCFSNYPGHNPYVNRYGPNMQDSHPRREFQHKFVEYHENRRAETVRMPPCQPPTFKYLQGYPKYNPDQTFYHHESSEIDPSDLFSQRSQNDPIGPNSHYHENPVCKGLQNYTSDGSSSLLMHCDGQEPLTRSSSDLDSRDGSFSYYQTTNVAAEYGNRQVFRPIAGGFPFIACCYCFEVLKLPRKRISMSKNQHKMKCGACSSIILVEIRNKGILVSVPAKIEKAPADVDDGYSGTMDENCGDVQCDSSAGAMNSCFNESKQRFSSRDKESNASEFLKQQDPAPSSSSFSVDEQSPDSLIFRKDPPTLAVLPEKEIESFPLPDSPIQECPNHCYANYDRYDKGNKSKRPDQESVGIDKATRSRNSVEDATVATETDISLNEFSNSCVSQDSVEVSQEDQRRTQKGGKSFLGLVKMITRDFSKSSENVEDERSNVFVNGHFIPDPLVKKAERLAGPIQPGEYWYDIRAGFWGVMGHPCLGIVMPNIKEFNYPLPENCAAGNTDVFVNGRELHQRDLDVLARRGLPLTQNKSYLIEISGKVVDEVTSEVLDNLGKLAPSVLRAKRGFGMKIPTFIARLQC